MENLPILIWFIFLSLSWQLLVSCQDVKLLLPPGTFGPEASAFDGYGHGPYCGVSGGRILKYNRTRRAFLDFAFTSPIRLRPLCNGNPNPQLEPICGRPLGVGFHYKTGLLFIAEPYSGLRMVTPKGGFAVLVSASADGVPYRFLNALDIDQKHDIIYFCDSSTRFLRRQFNEAVQNQDSTGRLLKYDLRTKRVTILLRNLGLPVGVAVSKDGDYVLVTEYLHNRALRFWLTGPKAFATEVFAMFPGRPDNIKRNAKGEFWVPVNNITGDIGTNVSSSNYIPSAIANSPESSQQGMVVVGTSSAAMRLGEDGSVRERVRLDVGGSGAQYSEFQEFKNRVFAVGSLNLNFVAVIIR